MSFQRPHFHLPEALSTHLGFTAERLLSNQGIRSGGAGVSLVLHHVMQLENIAYTNHCRLFIRKAGAAISESDLAAYRQACGFHFGSDLFFRNFFENGDSNFAAQYFFRPTKTGFKQLTQIHTRQDRQG